MQDNQERATVNGISPRVMCPSEASTCQRSRYSPGGNPVALADKVSAEVCLPISSGRTEPDGGTSVKRDRPASIRTLNRRLIAMSGPATVLFTAGADSSRTACAAAEAAVSESIAAPTNTTAKNFRRSGCMNSLFAVNRKVLRENCARATGAELYRSTNGLAWQSGGRAENIRRLQSSDGDFVKLSGVVRETIPTN